MTIFYRKKASVIGEIIFFYSVGLFSTIGNILIIVVIRKTKEFRKSQYVFKTSIAVSDIIWALVLCCNSAGKNHQYFNTTYTLECHPTLDDKETYVDYEVKHFDCQPRYSYYPSMFDDEYNVLIFILMKISLIVSLISLVFAAADRYFAIVFPFRYKNNNTIKISKVLSIVIWILSALITVFIDFYKAITFKNMFILLQPSSCENPNQISEDFFYYSLCCGYLHC